MTSRFHAGEIALQKATGADGRIAAAAGFIREFMLEQHRELFAKLPTLFVATLDVEGRPWASVLAGSPGFLSTPDVRTLRVAASMADADPSIAGLRAGAPIGLLGIEPHTRRRNRANGVISEVLPEHFAVHVTQSYGNCPKYIYARQPQPAPEHVPGTVQVMGGRLDEPALALIASSDTLFIASSSAAQFPAAAALGDAGTGVDMSHRGGLPGFVSVARDGLADRLTMPDYVGNYFFNTLGNFLQWPRAGLLFIDWHTGDLLQLTVDVELQTEGDAITAIPGAQRLVHMTVVRGTFRPHALALTWSEPVAPPQFAAGSPFTRR